MTRACSITLAGMMLFALSLSITSNALAHAGEEHANPVSALLHHGSTGIVTTVIVIGLTGFGFWLYGRRSPTTGRVESKR